MFSWPRMPAFWSGFAPASSMVFVWITPTACAIRNNISRACAPLHRTHGSWPKKSCNLPRFCAPTGRLMAPRDTTSSMYATGSLSMARASKKSTRSTANLRELLRITTRLSTPRKLAVAHEALGSDVNRLAQMFVEICENNRDRRDYTRAEIRRAIRDVAAGFSIYRTYVIPQRSEMIEEDQAAIQQRDSDCQNAPHRHRSGFVRLYWRRAHAARARPSRRRISASLSAVHIAGDGKGSLKTPSSIATTA